MSILATNPTDYMGGTWVEWGSGRVPVGFNADDGNFNVSEKTGGSSAVTLTASQSGVPAHSHGLNGHTHSIPALSGYTSTIGDHTHHTDSPFSPGGVKAEAYDGSATNAYYMTGLTERNSMGGGSHSHSVATYASTTGGNSGSTANNSATNASQSHTNLQPYITCYMFKRTA